MTRKIFRFFKHRGGINSIKSGSIKLKELLKKFEQTFKHDKNLKKDFLNSLEQPNFLETIGEEKSDSSKNQIDSSNDLIIPEESELKNIKSPEFIDSKTQLCFRIANEILGLIADFFGLVYYFFDHLSFLGKIDVIENPQAKKVNTFFIFNQRFLEN